MLSDHCKTVILFFCFCKWCFRKILETLHDISSLRLYIIVLILVDLDPFDRVT